MQRGTFASPSGAAPVALRDVVVDDGPGAAARLALYHEQAWKRFFVTAQQQYPRVVRVLGAFSFNRIVAAHVGARPSSSFDIAAIVDGLFIALRAALRVHLRDDDGDAALSAARDAARDETRDETAKLLDDALLRGGGVAGALVWQALHLDEAERRAFRAPYREPNSAPYREPDSAPDSKPHRSPRPRTGAAATNEFDSADRIVVARSFALVRLTWDVIDGASTAPPSRLPNPRHVVVARTATGVAIVDVHPAFARLLARAAREPLAAASAHVVDAVPPEVRDHVRALVPGWIDEAFARGWWHVADPG